jgi:phosphoglycolate phosphatase
MLFIFDWDGTLMDSTGRIVGAMQAAILELGLAARRDDEVREIIGLGLPEAIEFLYGELSLAERNVLQARYAHHYVAADQQPCEFFPSALTVLQQLKERGDLVAVATGKSRKGLRRVLDQLQMNDFFHATRCADETRSKPHPQMLHELLSELAAPLHDAVMIGDTEYDMAMARSVGMARIAVDFGAHAAERLVAYQPALVVNNLAQLLTWSAHRYEGSNSGQ